MTNIALARVDERLIHGQIINEWISVVNPTHLIIADDELIEDEFMSNIYRALVPIWLEIRILSIRGTASALREAFDERARVFILAKTPQVFYELIQQGVQIKEITFADKRYFPNKIKIPLANKLAINGLLETNVRLYAIQHPNDKQEAICKFKNIDVRNK